MDFVDNTLDTNSGTIRGRAVIANPKLLLTPGMFGHLRLLGSGTYEALLIPDESWSPTQQSDQVVYVVGRDNKIEQRKIRYRARLSTGFASCAKDWRQVITSSSKASSVKLGVEVSPKPGQIVPPHPGASPTPADLAPPPGAATFARPH